MITRYSLILESPRPLTEKCGYPLYSAFLRELPWELGEALHRETITPLSQHLRLSGNRSVWQFSLLGEESETLLSAFLDSVPSLYLESQSARVRIAGRICSRIESVDALLSSAAKQPDIQTLHFETTTAFKQNGQYLNLPSPELIVRNLANRWNGCIPDCPIEDEDGEGLEALSDGLLFRDFRLCGSIYRLKGNNICGFTGTLQVKNRLSGFQRQLLHALLIFASYAGVGIKTTLGMGGMSLSELDR